jgi:hypothetical protein
LMGLLILAQVLSVSQTSGLRPLTIPEILRKGFAPYLMGRLLLSDVADIRPNTAGIAKVILGLSALAAFECFVQMNVLNTILGRRFGLLEAGEGYRWGLKRAHVTFDHPIFFGMGLVLLLPWAMQAARFARTGAGPKWWRLLPAVLAAALVATVSRGPQMAAIATAGIYFFFRFRRIRIPLLILVVVLGGTAVTFKDELVEGLSLIAGEKPADGDVRVITIDGEEYEYSGTNHRVLLFKVYDRPAREAGAFGYGPEMKGVEIEEQLVMRFASIDCHYLLFTLQYGYLGIGAFLILTLGTLLNLTLVAWRTELPQSALAAGLCGALLSVAVLLMSVWFSPDFAGVWLFSAGLAAGLPSFMGTATADRMPAVPDVLNTPPLLPPAQTRDSDARPRPAHAPRRQPR